MTKTRKVFVCACGRTDKYARGMCQRCYMYNLRYGKPRPPDLKVFADEEDVERMIDLLMKGKSMYVIGKETGFDPRTVQSHLAGDSVSGQLARAGREREIDAELQFRLRARRSGLPSKDVAMMRERRQAGASLDELSHEYGISPSAASKIVNELVYQEMAR